MDKHGSNMLENDQILISARLVHVGVIQMYANALSGWVDRAHVLGRDAIPSSFGEPSGIS